MMKIGFIILLQFSLLASVCSDETFHESLKVNVLNNEQVYSYFNFTTVWDYKDKFQPQHYNLFPRAFGKLILKYNVAELHFTMTRGLWRYNKWGFPFSSSPIGAQLWVWFHKDTEDVDKNWVGFTNALSGLFCASINFMTKAKTVSPLASFRPIGLVENGEVETEYLKYATLARENVCTENLTPWLKLLPCGSNSGPASLLKVARQLHTSQFLSIGLHFSHDCNEAVCYNPFVKLEQQVSVVYDVNTLSGKKPYFDLFTMFHSKVKPACPLASSSKIEIKAPSGATVTPNFLKAEYGIISLNLLKQLDSDTNIKLKWVKNVYAIKSHSPGVTSHCYLTGNGLDGGLQCLLENHLNRNTTIMFFQVIPWFLYTQLHTLKLNSKTQGQIQPEWMSFSPAAIRESPHRLEVVLTLPSSSSTDLSIEFTRGFLKWTEHPPDASHGFYISPSVITVKTTDLDLSTDFSDSVQRIYSEALIINIPEPDFSMPYNVICLVCTVLAIAFGSTLNLVTKRFHMLSPNRVHPVKKKIQQLISLVKKKISKESRNIQEEEKS